ncbi:MAG: hypothetical protein F6K28_38220 [Microcoleus sp. SIO2G3]|nr:hypothetical protein [Microcoleus sp. SIO2G3]
MFQSLKKSTEEPLQLSRLRQTAEAALTSQNAIKRKKMRSHAQHLSNPCILSLPYLLPDLRSPLT